MKSPRRNKSLEILARSIKDSDQFVTHVCNVAHAYSKRRAFDAAANREVRQALKVFAKHAHALSQWLHSATGASTLEGQALRQIGLATHNPGAIGHSVGMRSWLQQLAEAGSAAAEIAPTAARDDALRAAAEGLRATFERHGLKLSQRASQQKHNDAVRLLCAVANIGGTSELEPARAQQWFNVGTASAAKVRKAAASAKGSKRRER